MTEPTATPEPPEGPSWATSQFTWQDGWRAGWVADWVAEAALLEQPVPEGTREATT